MLIGYTHYPDLIHKEPTRVQVFDAMHALMVIERLAARGDELDFIESQDYWCKPRDKDYAKRFGRARTWLKQHYGVDKTMLESF